MASPADRPTIGDRERGNAVADFVLASVLIMALLLAVRQLAVRVIAAGEPSAAEQWSLHHIG